MGNLECIGGGVGGDFDEATTGDGAGDAQEAAQKVAETVLGKRKQMTEGGGQYDSNDPSDIVLKKIEHIVKFTFKNRANNLTQIVYKSLDGNELNPIYKKYSIADYGLTNKALTLFIKLCGYDEKTFNEECRELVVHCIYNEYTTYLNRLGFFCADEDVIACFVCDYILRCVNYSNGNRVLYTLDDFRTFIFNRPNPYSYLYFEQKVNEVLLSYELKKKRSTKGLSDDTSFRQKLEADLVFFDKLNKLNRKRHDKMEEAYYADTLDDKMIQKIAIDTVKPVVRHPSSMLFSTALKHKSPRSIQHTRTAKMNMVQKLKEQRRITRHNIKTRISPKKSPHRLSTTKGHRSFRVASPKNGNHRISAAAAAAAGGAYRKTRKRR